MPAIRVDSQNDGVVGVSVDGAKSQLYTKSPGQRRGCVGSASQVIGDDQQPTP
jgi:hypothetical protein